jgi:hypothetical protein
MCGVKATLAAAIVLLAACGTSGSNDAGADASCTGEQPICCNGCLDDVLRPPVCTNGAWVCPAGAVTESDCVGKCRPGTFCTYLPKAVCASCTDGTMTKMICNEDAGELACPAGTHDTTIDAGCASDASAD